MLRIVLLAVIIKFNNGFLLDTKNTTLPGKPVYLTAAEYYGDKNQLHQEIEFQHQQQESYRTQTDKALQLLATQLQQRLAAMEQQIIGKNRTQPQTLDSLALKYQELEEKYTNLKKKQDTWEQQYKELEQKYSTLEQNYTQSQKACVLKIDTLTNKTIILEQKIGGLEQLKSVNQLKDFQTLEQKVQTFDSRINLLSSHEQARNQDFLALYNLTTSEIHVLTNKTLNRFDFLERNHNNSIAALQNAEKGKIDSLNNSIAVLQNAEKQKFDTLNNSIAALQNEETRKFDTLNNFTSDSRSKINALEKSTSNKMDFLAQNLNMSFSALQQNIDKNNEKVVLSSCRYNGINYNPAPKIITFPIIINAIGITNPSLFTSTGKFTCHVPGMYHISTVISSTVDNLVIDIMKNSASVHHQNINGNTNSGSYYTPGATVVALELKTNDKVWVQTRSPTEIHYSCFTIFKI